MAVEKRVLLARPHTFIVNEMRPFLAAAGYVPVGAASLEQLAEALGRPALQGAVISTALSSSINADAATVFRLIREKRPDLPVVFAGLADLDTVKVSALRAVKDQVPSPVIAGPAAYRPPAATERGSTFLVLRKEDIAAGHSQEAAMRALRAHFA
ncbi:MAG: hypothetical protein KGI90_17420 [Burkholderiales bacterium]|nr:hypothetical protein [Burkholderiales bacterium]MDE2274757.1 hypothetical protein [Burkholderiales bacterium]